MGPVGPEGSRKTYDAFISYAHDGDGGFTAALQRGLQHLAKPWNRRRAMEVFRDETSLPVSAGLLPSIRRALDASRWFVLLASPEAGRSARVGQEITHWVSAKGADHLLVVVTNGTWIWDNDACDLSPASTAGSRALRGVFATEPRYLDMTWAGRNADLTLRNPRFRDQVATLAAAIREIRKEEIEGEDVRQQRRVRRLVRAVIATLTVLVLLASVLAVSFNFERLQAIQQRDAADSGQLISESQILSGTDPTLSILLSVAAWRLDQSQDARHAMLVAATHPVVPTGILDDSLPAAVAFSPDGKTLAGGSYDDTIRLWNVATHQQIGKVITGHVDRIYSLALSGTTLAAGGADGTVRLWDAATGREIGHPLAAVLTGRAIDTVVFSVAFSPDGKMLATGGADGVIRLWQVSDGRQIATPLTGHTSTVTSLAFSPDGTMLASGSDDDTIRLWNVATHLEIGGPLTGHTDVIDSVAFSPDGATLASSSLDGTARCGCGTWPPAA